MNRLLILPALALLLCAAAANPGAEIVEHGAPGGVIPCRVCHGMRLQGNSVIGAPALAGLPQSTTLTALTAIASGTQGKNFAMKHVAQALDPAQRKAIAAYLAALPKAPAS